MGMPHEEIRFYRMLRLLSMGNQSLLRMPVCIPKGGEDMSADVSGASHLEPRTSGFQPVKLLEVELDRPLLAIPVYDRQAGKGYRRAQVLVCLHAQPLGLVDLEWEETGPDETQLAERIWQTLAPAINEHLHEDGLPEAAGLSARGLQVEAMPPCLQARAQFLAHAPFASVIVCTRDRAEHLERCLDLLTQLAYPHYEIIVVDNAPKTLATADLVARRYAHLASIRYVREDRPGLAWARNCGLEHARGEIVAYIDDDERPSPHWLTELARGFASAENVACVTGLCLPAELETPAQVWFEQFGGLYRERGFRELAFNLTNHRPRDPLFPYMPSKMGVGGNMAFSTAPLRTLGGFDPALGTGTMARGGEEGAAFLEVIKKGYTLIYRPAALVRHFHHRDYDGYRRQLYGYGVSVTAFLTASIMRDPRRILDLAAMFPSALRYLLSPQSPRSAKMQDYPKELNRLEMKGMLYGPLAYMRSQWHLRSIMRQFGPQGAPGGNEGGAP